MSLANRARLLCAASLILGAGLGAAMGIPRVLDSVAADLRAEDDSMREIASVAYWATDRRTAAKVIDAIERAARTHKPIVAAEMALSNGRSLLRYGRIDRLRNAMSRDPREVRSVAVLQNGRPWGEVRVLFEPVVRASAFNPRSPLFWALVGFAILVLPIAGSAMQAVRRRLDRSPDGPIAVAAERARHTLDTLAEGVLLLDASSRILFANHTVAESMGLPGRELIGRRVSDLGWMAPAGSSGQTWPWETAVQEGRPQRGVRVGLECPEGVRSFIVNCTPLLKRRKVLHGLLVTLDDVTELEEGRIELQRARDAAQQANEAKSRFLAMMSHEIRTPLNGVCGSLQLLKKTGLRERQPQYVEAAQFSASTLLHLINDILDFSKIEAGQLDLSPIDFDLERCIDDTMLMMAPNAVGKGLDLAYEIGADVDLGVRADPDRIRQIVVNLLNNAIKFTQRGSVCLRVGVDHQDADRQLLRCDVTDTGIGIPQEKMDRLFKAFSQVDSSTSRRYGGTGLGLVISKQLCEMMGGSVEVRSEEGKGTTFTFTLDLPRTHLAAVETIEAHDKPSLCIAAGLHECEARSLGRALGLAGGALILYPTAAALASALSEIAPRVTAGRTLVILADRRAENLSGVAAQVRRALPAPSLSIMGALYPDEHPAPDATSTVNRWVRRPIGAARLRRALHAGGGAGDSAIAARPGPAAGFDLAGLRVLLAEDNDVGRMVVADMLRSAGVHCDTAADGNAALQAVQRERYDLVLMDCFMPDMDGFEATKKIRELQHRGALPASLRVIALTAKAMRGDREACLEAGMDGYLTKPVDESQLLSTVAAHAGRGTGTAPHPAPAAETPADVSRLRDRYSSKPELLVKLVDAFRTTATEDLARIQAAIQAADAAGLEHAAHRLKGGAGFVCADRVSRLAGELEHRAAEHQLEGLRELSEQIGREIAESFQSLDRFVESVRTQPPVLSHSGKEREP